MNINDNQELNQNLKDTPLTDKHTKPHTPWYLQLLLGFSGWLAGIFLMSFLGMLFSDFSKGYIWLGLFLLLIAAGMLYANHNQKNDFVENLALSISVAGQIGFTFGLFELFSYTTTYILLIMALLQLVLVVVMSNFLHRLISTGLASVLFYAHFYMNDLVYFANIWLISLLGVSLLCWLQTCRLQFYRLWQLFLKPITYGITLAVLGLHVFIAGTDKIDFPQQEIMSVFLLNLPTLLMLVLASLLVWHLFKRHQLALFSIEGLLASIAIVVFAVADNYSFGIMVSLLYLLVGFAQANRLLQGLSMLALLGFISIYYYFLGVSLLYKSILLGVLGLVLLLSRFGLQKLGILPIHQPHMMTEESDYE